MKIDVSTFRESPQYQRAAQGYLQLAMFFAVHSHSGLNYSFFSCVVQRPTMPLPPIALQSCSREKKNFLTAVILAH